MTLLEKLGDIGQRSPVFSNRTVALSKVRISVHSLCNFSCGYCRPGGDGTVNHKSQMPIDRAIFIARVFQKIGCDKLNITGGEPFLHSDLLELINGIRELGTYQISINTNGSLQPFALSQLKGIERLRLIVSLDSINDEKIELLGRTRKSLLAKNFIREAADLKLKLRINSVIVNAVNDGEGDVKSLVEFAEDVGIDLKLQSVFETSDDMFMEASSLYKKLDFVPELLKQWEYRKTAEVNKHNGVTEAVYTKDGGNFIRVLDKNPAATRYNSLCRSCSRYPCDTGIYAFYVTTDEKLLACRNRRDAIFDFSNETNVESTALALEETLVSTGYESILRE